MLRLDRDQILAFRRRTNGLAERSAPGPEALRRAAWAGLQDSMPRAALLSLHARVTGIAHEALDDPALAQLWGPRYSVYAVAAEDFALFSLARLPPKGRTRERALALAERLRTVLDGGRMTDREAQSALGAGPSLRYATLSGSVAIRWDGARAPVVWMVAAPEDDPADLRRELARRFLHVFGPATGEDFAAWAGLPRRLAADTFAALAPELLGVDTPVGDALLLAADEPLARAAPAAEAPARLLPSGDAYYLLPGEEQRALLVGEEDRRERLWTSRVWPGALLVGGALCGTWRRAQHTVTVDAWEPLPPAARDAVEAEAATLPLGLDRPVEVRWP